MVRDPVARNMSAFFENLEHKTNLALFTPTTDLIDKFFKSYPHGIPEQWFDEELKQVFGFDVFSLSFDHVSKSLRSDFGGYRFLVLRTEESNSEKEALLREFLNTPDLSLGFFNVGGRKQYADVYKEFRSAIKKDARFRDYVNEIYRSRYARHFYTDVELTEFKRQWLGPIDLDAAVSDLTVAQA